MALKDAIKRLPDREKEIIKLRYFDGKTQMEVSKWCGFHRHRSADLRNLL